MTEHPTAPLPVITTNLLEKRERGYLAWVAVANEIAKLPLESPPIDASTHALEIRVESYDQPLIVLADPMGAPTTEGFPLRLRPLDEEQENALRLELFSGGAAQEAPKPQANHKISMVGISAPAEATVSADHANALNRMTQGGASSAAKRTPGSLKGRSLGDGRFILDKLLGGGASGEVYKAVHTALRRPVAVKVLHTTLQQSEDYATRFYAEALAASRLDHRNVLRVIDYGQEADGLLYIVMELITGKSFMDILLEEGPLSEERIVDLVSQACAGLAHAHDAGVIHRDIKPENILVVKVRDDEGKETDCAKVCDFGIAQWTPPKTEGGSQIPKVDASKIVGTPGYMAPEQIQNDPVDARTDVYALGVVMYELATGRVPFLSEDAMEILTCHMVETPEPPSTYQPSITPRLERLIMKALEKEPERRHDDMRDLRAALRHLVDDDWASTSGSFRKISIRQTPLTASDFVNDTANALGVLHDIEERDRAAGFSALSEALKLATMEGRTKLARDLVAWLHTRLADPGLPDAEKDLAQRALHVLREPEVARQHAIKLLDGKIDHDEAALTMLREAGPLAARALIDSRRVRPPGLELRARFVATLRAIGPSALPVIIAALEPLAAVASRHDEAMAEDLLRSLPDGRSDAAGDVTVRFVRLDKPTLGVTALRATTALWGVRARPLLVGVLDSNDDAFRAIAIEELYRLGCIDDVVVERLGRIVLGQQPAGEELKVAAASVFGAATTDARTRATGILVTRLAPEKGLMSSIRSALGPRDDQRFVVALARALFLLDPAGSRVVLERFAGGRPDVRPHIDAILAGR
ncbi:MAG: serine/threonine protein kinase [Labilithrix sp.]|nr:serine/threonine protein kinase [Labilithrix sp.]MCW5817970.1 serine/threonine protein kinase [Labilithrix sp.]